MPIGKNSIKRVANNGYSKVTSSAPDMENGTVIGNPSPEVIEVMIPSSEKIAPKKTAAKKPAAKKTVKKTDKTEEKSTVGYINLGGGDLPVHLL